MFAIRTLYGVTFAGVGPRVCGGAPLLIKQKRSGSPPCWPPTLQRYYVANYPITNRYTILFLGIYWVCLTYYWMKYACTRADVRVRPSGRYIHFHLYNKLLLRTDNIPPFFTIESIFIFLPSPSSSSSSSSSSPPGPGMEKSPGFFFLLGFDSCSRVLMGGATYTQQLIFIKE